MVIDKVKLLKNIIIDIISNGKKKDWKAYSLEATNTTEYGENCRSVWKSFRKTHVLNGLWAPGFPIEESFLDNVKKALAISENRWDESLEDVPTGFSVDKMYQNESKQTAEDIKNYQLKFYYDNKWKPEYDEWMYLLAGWTVNKDYPLIAWNAALTYDMIFTQPVVYEFPKLKVPTLLIIGTRDRTALGKANASADVQSKMGLYQNLGKETQKKIPNSRLVEIENIGHLPHIEAFDKFIKPLVEFLK